VHQSRRLTPPCNQFRIGHLPETFAYLDDVRAIVRLKAEFRPIFR
jgi:hypothetical protein